MADLSKIKLDNIVYNVKDATARSDLDNKMTKGTDYVTAGQLSGSTLGTSATAEGNYNIATGNYSHAEGSGTVASSASAHAEGHERVAYGVYSHAEGDGQPYTTTTLYLTTTETDKRYEYYAEDGQSNITDVTVGKIVIYNGLSRKITNVNTTDLYIDLDSSFPTTLTAAQVKLRSGSSGARSHAEGYSTTASGGNSHAEGYSTTASGGNSHAEGNSTTASGDLSHAEGWNTVAQRKSQHVFGEYNVLDVTGTTATHGDYVEIVGNGTANNARSNARTLDWDGNETLAGNLTAGANIIADGVLSVAGDAWVGGELDVSGDVNIDGVLDVKKRLKYSSSCTDAGYVPYSRANRLLWTENDMSVKAQNHFADATHVGINVVSNEVTNATAATPYAGPIENFYVEGSTRLHGLVAEGDDTIASGSQSHAEGYKTIALSNYTHVEGYGIRSNNTLKLTGIANATTYTYSNPGNVGSILVGRIIYIPRLQIARKITAVDTDNTSITLSSTFGEALNNENAELRGGASGTYSHSEGYFSTASGTASHSEGAYNIASGDWAHAEGYTTRASGDYSHAEGYTSEATNTYAHVEGNDNIASGNASHVEGAHNIASGTLAHAEGFWTLGSSRMNHVFGQANIEDTNTSGTGGAHTPTKIGTYIEIVGNGTVNSSGTVTKRSNARTLDWDGNEVLAGKLTIGAAPTANMDVTTKKYVDDGLGAKQATITAGTYLQFGTGTSAATLSHKNSGVTAGTSGSSTDYSGTSFAVPWFTVDAQGHVTARGTRNISITGLSVAAGGTGVSSFTANSVIMSGSSTTAALTTRTVTNNTSATAVAQSTNIPTLNTIYNGLAVINNATQKRDVTIYAPTTAGTAGYILKSSGGTAAPVWLQTLPVANGGTGLTASPSMTVNLASTSAANVLQASPQPGVTGTLPVDNGGTGRTTMSYKNAVLIGNSSTVTNPMQPIRTASGAFYATDQDAKPSFGTLPIAQGGTGATTAAAARTNLNVPPSPRSNLIGTSFIPPVTNVGNWVTSYITVTPGADYTTIQVSDASHNGLYYLTTGVTITSSSYKNKTYYLRLRWATPSSSSLVNNKDLQFKSTVVNDVCVLQSLDGATTLQPGSSSGIWSDSNATYGIRVGVGLDADSKIKVIVRIDAGFNYTKDSSGNPTTTANKIKLGAIKLEIGADSTLVDGNNNLYGNINYQTGLLAVRKGGTGRNTMSYKNAVPIGNATTVTDAMQVVRTASGAFYATAQDAAPSFGTLPVAQGGTGLTSLPTGVLMYNSGITNDLPDAPTSLNNITATGFYKFQYSTHSSTSSNSPWTAAAYSGYTAVLLHIAYSSNNCAQLAIKTGTSGNVFYKRACYNGTWTSWSAV